MSNLNRGLRQRHFQFGPGGKIGFLQKRAQIEMAMTGPHGVDGLIIATSLPLRPLARIAVPSQLDAVEIGIVQIERDMGTVVVVAIDLPAIVQQPLKGNRQIAPGRIVDGEVVEPGASTLWWLATRALPSIQRDVVMVATGREKRSGAHVVQQIEPEHIPIERDGAIEIGDLQMHVPDMGSGRDGLVGQG